MRGAGRVALTIARELVRRGHDLVPLDWQDNPVVGEIAGRCEIVPARPGPARTPRWHFSLLRRIRHLEHDVLVNPTAYPHVLGSHPRLAMFVLDLHMLERDSHYQRGKRAWFQLFLGRGLKRARRLICISEFTRSVLLKRYPNVEASRTTVIHPPFDPTLDPDSGGAPIADRPYLLGVGHLEHRKNQLRLIEAFATARESGLDCDLRLAGQVGPGGEAIVARMMRSDVAGAVHWHRGPSDTELRQLYRHARGLLFPSLCEGFGLPLLEAMRFGLPILTSNCTALPEVAGADAALLVDPLDVAAIARGIVDLDRDAALRERLVAAGARRLEQFTPEAKVAELERVLEAMLPAKAGQAAIA